MRDPAERLRDHACETPCAARLARDLGDEGVEIAAAFGGVSGGGEENGESGEDESGNLGDGLARGHELVLKWAGGAVAPIFA